MCPNKFQTCGSGAIFKQATVFLEIFSSTKSHLAPSAMDMSVSIHSVVIDWANIVRSFHSGAVVISHHGELCAQTQPLRDVRLTIHLYFTTPIIIWPDRLTD